MVPHTDPPSATILLGRSGSGKTTVLVFRMFHQWHAAYKDEQATCNAVFITASATLREQVALSFRKLQAAVVSTEDAVQLAAKATAAEESHTLAAVPSEAFPLFLNASRWLKMLDGTLDGDKFFRRDKQGRLLEGQGDMLDGDDMEQTVSMCTDFDESPQWGEYCSESTVDDATDTIAHDLHWPSNERPKEAQDVRKAPMCPRRLLTYQVFVCQIWPRMARKAKGHITAGLVYQEILTYIKGSTEAAKKAPPVLNRDEYLKVGRKRAPNFNGSREEIWELFEQYEWLKVHHGMYDRMDLIASLHERLAPGYNGTQIDALYRDEVQDFCQTELLLDLRVVPINNLFYCGDTCQTIARGVGFRFEDIRSLFFSEREGQKGNTNAFMTEAVAVPDLQHLKVNYRTHTGIMDVAASIVDVLQCYFPQHMDQLDRESAHFSGPRPLMLASTQPSELVHLLSKSTDHQGRVDLGAHKVVLIRTQDTSHKLPPGLLSIKGLLMTVPQSKGLEFDDVYIVDFFANSPASKEWRVLLSYLETLAPSQAQGQPLPGGGRLHTASSPETWQGLLRPLPFDEQQHILLSQELKHLYTAVTRAKNQETRQTALRFFT